MKRNCRSYANFYGEDKDNTCYRYANGKHEKVYITVCPKYCNKWVAIDKDSLDYILGVDKII